MKILTALLIVVFLIGCVTKPLDSCRKNRKDFSKKEELAVWQKAKPTDNPNLRIDICESEIHHDQYGKKSEYGWEIDHIKPISKCGGNEINNLQPLYWKTNKNKSDKWPVSPKDYCSKQ